MRRTVIYARVSTREQAEEGYSLESQIEGCRTYCRAMGWPVPGDGAEYLYVDDGYTGSNTDRPALQRLLRDAARGQIERVVMTKLDRLGRKARDVLNLDQELGDAGTSCVYYRDGIDTSTAIGRLLRTVLAAVAELERETILERSSDGQERRAKNGEISHRYQVYGYKRVEVSKGQWRWEPDPATAPVVIRIFTLLATGTSASRLAVLLTTEGVPTPRGGRVWRHTAIRQIVRNTAYEGRASFRATRQVVLKVDGHERTVTRPNPDPASISYVPFPALVSAELAEEARAGIVRGRIESPRNSKRQYLLGHGLGLLVCGAPDATGTAPDGVCGHQMGGFQNKSHAPRYACNHLLPTGQLRRHFMPAASLEETVWQALHNTLLHPETVLAEAEALADAGSHQARRLANEVAALERTRSEIAAQQKKLLDLYLSPQGMAADLYREKAADLAAQDRDLAATIAARRTQQEAAAAQVLPIGDIKATCAPLASC
jgi:DNA invertase Pin-like site-specific DNA recombinase